MALAFFGGANKLAELGFYQVRAAPYLHNIGFYQVRRARPALHPNGSHVP
jgi:hypothetical protein